MALVLWSGGLDSTLVALHLGRRYRDNDPPDKHGLRLLAINHKQVRGNEESQRARERLLVEFKKDDIKYQYVQVNVGTKDNSAFDAGSHPGGLVQPLVWLATAVPYLILGEDLYLGYIRSDCVRASLADFYGCFEHLIGMSACKSKLQLPLVDSHEKVDIMRELPQSIAKLCWWCETPMVDSDMFVKAKDKKRPLMKLSVKGNGKPCGNCMSCKTHYTAQWHCDGGYRQYVDNLNGREPDNDCYELPDIDRSLGLKTKGDRRKVKRLIPLTTKRKSKLTLGPHNIKRKR